MVKTAVSRRGFLAASAGVRDARLRRRSDRNGRTARIRPKRLPQEGHGEAQTSKRSASPRCARDAATSAAWPCTCRTAPSCARKALKEHPHTGGYLCGRGQGYVKVPYAENRVRTPLKADGSGGFQEVSWDEALSDIAQHMQEAGPQSTGWFQDGRGTDSYYTKRLMSAFGSANYYDESALRRHRHLHRHPHGHGAYPAPSAGKSKCIVLLDKSSYEGVRPHEIEEIIKARGERGHCVRGRSAPVLLRRARVRMGAHQARNRAGVPLGRLVLPRGKRAARPGVRRSERQRFDDYARAHRPVHPRVGKREDRHRRREDRRDRPRARRGRAALLRRSAMGRARSGRAMPTAPSRSARFCS